MPDCNFCQQPLPEGAVRCPRCGTPVGQGEDDRYERHGTLIEPVRSTVSESAMESDLQRSDTVREPDETSPWKGKKAVPFRPVYRAPMAVLRILDDGRDDRGESVRIRSEQTIIGRTGGDIVIPHDNGISGTHAEIVREFEQGQYRWILRDLNSRNGTFVRVMKARLAHNQQVLIGANRFRFDAAPQGTEASDAQSAGEGDPDGTRPWQAVSPADLAKLIPSIVELGPHGEGERYLLEKPENVIGTGADGCDVAIPDDPFISPVHCRVFRDERDRWTIENLNSLNGVWLRADSTMIEGDGQFQLGEQRFSLRIL